MGILTTLDTDLDEEEGVRRVFAITKWGIGTRTQLNRLAGRASVSAGVGQRTLVAAAYKKEGIDLAWSMGLGRSVAPEEKFTDAKRINYYSEEMDTVSNVGDVYTILTDSLRDMVDFGNYREEETLHVWEIPLDL